MIILPKPVRMFDSRDSGRKVVGELQIEIEDVGIPDGIVAVSVTVTATQPDGSGYVTVWSEGSRPNASCLNYHDQSVANTTQVGITGGDDEFMVYAHTATHLIFDLVGYEPEDQ